MLSDGAGASLILRATSVLLLGKSGRRHRGPGNTELDQLLAGLDVTTVIGKCEVWWLSARRQMPDGAEHVKDRGSWTAPSSGGWFSPFQTATTRHAHAVEVPDTSRSSHDWDTALQAC
jgi:hypothetical protein